MTFLARLLGGELLSAASLAAMHEARIVGGALAGRPWTRTRYGLGLMAGAMSGVGRVVGHSGAGPDGVSALYAFWIYPDGRWSPTCAQGSDEGIAEAEAMRLALAA